jgi:hypothetical protein
MTANKQDRKEERIANTGLAKVVVQCSASTFVVKLPPSPSRKPLAVMQIDITK